ncbi:DUF1800 domain-containing protein [Vibrio sp. SCSIO 43140]|uniref:DUF1800 domain-containing protein n=1 Tax=Vibrio sp. SCSIO 43140 TaxID=2819100 RepID=UPI002075E6CA|nr:DUF1800 domain-containing protein [Vibrio sp. SCSIO 43140]USD62834.1 DUF1800 domain-containing protein [Vibrio sp. SCSIO 43140]
MESKETAQTSTSKYVVSQRFGFGPRVGDAKQEPALNDQLKATPYTHRAITELPSTTEMLAHLGDLNRRRKEATTPEEKKLFTKSSNAFFQENFQTIVHARNLQTLTTPLGFQERLIQFWSNHFAISADNRRVRPIAAGIENEVIRELWSIDFPSMLLAVCQHPTMLMYLDNHRSIGPNSKAGQKRNKGLNENLAREILELHTLGVDGGYSQNDVIELAQGLTGWTVSFKTDRPGYQFSDAMHEPGAINVLGKVYEEGGEEQAISCLRDLANHENTAKHLCSKLVQHFYGSGHPSLVDELTKVWLENEGMLIPVYITLINSTLKNSSQQLRFRTPQEWYFAVLRSADFEPNARQMQQMLRQLGQPPFMPGSPAGWSDKDSDYNSSSALTQRWQVANQIAKLLVRQMERSKQNVDDKLIQMTQRLYGSEVDEHVLTAMDKAQDPTSKLVVLWMSPQFQYR